MQRDQPEGVPPLALTGERTLPDVPEENYWFRRHLVVYEWIAARVAGQRVIDMACGEGYGSDVLARAAASVVGVDANPEAHEHARLRYRPPTCASSASSWRRFSEPADAVVFLQTIEHLTEPTPVRIDAARRTSASTGFARRAGAARCIVSTPNVLTLAPKGAERSGNPWHVHEYRARGVRAAVPRALLTTSRCTACSTRASCARTSSRCAPAGTAVHPRLGLTQALLRLVHAGDRRLGLRAARRRARPSSTGALDFLAVCRP